MPPVNTPTSQPVSPSLVAIGSPEFDQAVAAKVADMIAKNQTALTQELAQAKAILAAQASVEPTVIGVPQPVVIQPTSIDTSQPGPDDLTVRFTRFCTFQNRGYQRGEEAGFPRKAAEDLQRSQAAFIVWDPRIHEPRYARRAA